MSEVSDNNSAKVTKEIPSNEGSNLTPTGELQNIHSAYRLNGKNYLKWSQLVRTFLKGKGKLSHLLGTGPKEEDPRFQAWDEQDSMVMSWLWNSMLLEISDTCMFLATAAEIWETVKQTYSKVRDAAQIYEIKTKISSTKQGSWSITEYSNLLQSLWQEMDHYQCIQMKCSDDAALLKRLVEKDRIYDFLAGLNIEFDAVRVQILGKEDLPTLNETIAIVRAEEGRRCVMIEHNSVNNSSALATTKGRNFRAEQPTEKDNKQPTFSSKSGNKNSMWCSHCQKDNHTEDKCWKIHGRPQSSNKNWTAKTGYPKRQGKAYAAASEQQAGEDNSQGSPIEFNREEMEKLKSFLGSLEKPTTRGTCTLAFSGTGHEEDDWTC
ncbi:uncharacterized protein [Henckelia pumila]|uniref:uncharacterized protein n=1 Tax=Henckelia pumila TaxID=405737 RepID=UPI003C6E875B